jgi:transposase-like protein
VTETIEPMAAQIDQEQLAKELVAKAVLTGVELVGPGGMLTGLTKSVLETALETEMTEHLGYDKHDPTGPNGGNSRNGTRTKTVLTEIGPVQIEVPRDRDGSFEPALVRKRQRRLTGIDEIVLSLTARGLTTGEIAAHFAEVYGAKVSKDTISKITDKVIEEMTAWQNRPLDRAVSTGRCEFRRGGVRMTRYAPNKMPTVVKRRYFELIRAGLSGSAAADEVGVSLSCGSLWFIGAGPGELHRG